MSHTIWEPILAWPMERLLCSTAHVRASFGAFLELHVRELSRLGVGRFIPKDRGIYRTNGIVCWDVRSVTVMFLLDADSDLGALPSFSRIASSLLLTWHPQRSPEINDGFTKMLLSDEIIFTRAKDVYCSHRDQRPRSRDPP